MISWLLALLASSQVLYELLALVYLKVYLQTFTKKEESLQIKIEHSMPFLGRLIRLN